MLYGRDLRYGDIWYKAHQAQMIVDVIVRHNRDFPTIGDLTCDLFSSNAARVEELFTQQYYDIRQEVQIKNAISKFGKAY